MFYQWFCRGDAVQCALEAVASCADGGKIIHDGGTVSTRQLQGSVLKVRAQ